MLYGPSASESCWSSWVIEDHWARMFVAGYPGWLLHFGAELCVDKFCINDWSSLLCSSQTVPEPSFGACRSSSSWIIRGCGTHIGSHWPYNAIFQPLICTVFSGWSACISNSGYQFWVTISSRLPCCSPSSFCSSPILPRIYLQVWRQSRFDPIGFKINLDLIEIEDVIRLEVSSRPRSIRSLLFTKYKLRSRWRSDRHWEQVLEKLLATNFIAICAPSPWKCWSLVRRLRKPYFLACREGVRGSDGEECRPGASLRPTQELWEVRNILSGDLMEWCPKQA